LTEQLKEAIRQSGKSLNQIGKEAGVGSNQLSRFMRGIRGLTLNAADKICDALGLELAPRPKTRKTRSRDCESEQE
jgi:transcriptional regulator with XRE-family HTH domain